MFGDDEFPVKRGSLEPHTVLPPTLGRKEEGKGKTPRLVLRKSGRNLSTRAREKKKGNDTAQLGSKCCRIGFSPSPQRQGKKKEEERRSRARCLCSSKWNHYRACLERSWPNRKRKVITIHRRKKRKEYGPRKFLSVPPSQGRRLGEKAGGKMPRKRLSV